MKSRRNAPKSNLRPRISPKKKDSSISWEEQKQLEKALLASLYEKSRGKISGVPTKYTADHSKLKNSPRTSAVTPVSRSTFNCHATALQVSPVADSAKKDKDVTPSKITSADGYPYTEDFVRFLCFRGTNFLPEDLKPLEDLPLQRAGKYAGMTQSADTAASSASTSRRSQDRGEPPNVSTKVSASTGPTKKAKPMKRRK